MKIWYALTKAAKEGLPIAPAPTGPPLFSTMCLLPMPPEDDHQAQLTKPE
jgi:hypothetical protein